MYDNKNDFIKIGAFNLYFSHIYPRPTVCMYTYTKIVMKEINRYKSILLRLNDFLVIYHVRQINTRDNKSISYTLKMMYHGL